MFHVQNKPTGPETEFVLVMQNKDVQFCADKQLRSSECLQFQRSESSSLHRWKQTDMMDDASFFLSLVLPPSLQGWSSLCSCWGATWSRSAGRTRSYSAEEWPSLVNWASPMSSCQVSRWPEPQHLSDPTFRASHLCSQKKSCCVTEEDSHLLASIQRELTRTLLFWYSCYYWSVELCDVMWVSRVWMFSSCCLSSVMWSTVKFLDVWERNLQIHKQQQ